MEIKTVNIRAVIEFGDIIVATPYVLSFNVTKTRNTKSTFNARIKILGDSLQDMSDNKITIKAGEKDNIKTIFTGYILQVKPSICWDDPDYVILSISGADILYKLEGEKYTRRQISSYHKWAAINSVDRKAKKNGKFQLINKPMLKPTEDAILEDEKENKKSYGADLAALGINAPYADPVDVELEFGDIIYEGDNK